MKKIIAIISALAVIISFSACGNEPKNNDKTSSESKSTTLDITETHNTITATFIVRNVDGTVLTLVKVMGEDFEKSVYICDIGNLMDSDDMSYQEGDRLEICYDADSIINDTVPYQITAYSIKYTEE